MQGDQSGKKAQFILGFFAYGIIIEGRIVKQRESRTQMELFSVEKFVPEEHLLRKRDSAVD